MKNKYECFVESFRQKLVEATGYEESRIYYKKNSLNF